MTIRRAPRPRRSFTVLANATIEDRRLSFKALGLLTYLLSKPDNWTINREHLAGTHTDGAESVRTALQELRSAGYIHDEIQRGPTGKLLGKFAVVYDVAQSDDPEAAPPPSVENPASRSGQQTGGTRVVRTEEEQSLNEQTVVTSREQLTLDTRPNPRSQPARYLAVGADLGSDRDLAFVEFWNRYPRKAGKGQARKAWAAARRRGVMPEGMVAGAERYRDDPNREDAYTKHAATWLNGECWDDEPLPDKRPDARPVSRMAGTMAALSAVAAGSPREDQRGQLPTRTTTSTTRPALGAGS